MNVTRDILYEGPSNAGPPRELISDLEATGCLVTRTGRHFTASTNFGEIVTAGGALEDILAGVSAFSARGMAGANVAVLDPYFVCGVDAEKQVYHAIDHRPDHADVSLCEGLPVKAVARRFGLYYSKNCPGCEAAAERL